MLSRALTTSFSRFLFFPVVAGHLFVREGGLSLSLLLFVSYILAEVKRRSQTRTITKDDLDASYSPVNCAAEVPKDFQRRAAHRAPHVTTG